MHLAVGATDDLGCNQYFIVGKSSQHRDPAEFSRTFWNISLVCNLLYLLIGLQRKTPYSKSNQLATGFLRHLVHLGSFD